MFLQKFNKYKKTYNSMIKSENTGNRSCIDGNENIIFLIRDNYLL